MINVRQVFWIFWPTTNHIRAGPRVLQNLVQATPTCAYPVQPRASTTSVALANLACATLAFILTQTREGAENISCQAHEDEHMATWTPPAQGTSISALRQHLELKISGGWSWPCVVHRGGPSFRVLKFGFKAYVVLGFRLTDFTDRQIIGQSSPMMRE